jgi:hypothetical protein
MSWVLEIYENVTAKKPVKVFNLRSADAARTKARKWRKLSSFPVKFDPTVWFRILAPNGTVYQESTPSPFWKLEWMQKGDII